MSNIFIPETVDIPFDTLTNEQRDAIVLIMTEKGFQNPLTNIIDRALNLCDIEIQKLISYYPLPFVDDPWPGQNAFSVNGFFPLFETPEEAAEKSPLPNYSRPGETTEGYHVHTLNGTDYYMPNGLGGPENIKGTQFHGTYGTTGYGATAEEETYYHYDESGVTVTTPYVPDVILGESGLNAYDPTSWLYQMGEGGWTIGVPPVADEVSGNSYGACIVNGVCEINTIPGCNNIGGVFMGENTICAGDYFAGDTGSCCLNDYGNCVSLNQLDCAVTGGVYGGSGSTCGIMGSTIGANGEVVYLLCSSEATLGSLTRFDIHLSNYTGTFQIDEDVFSDGPGQFNAKVDSWWPQTEMAATLRVYDIVGTLSSDAPDIITGAISGATGEFFHIVQSPTGDNVEEGGGGDGGGTYSAPGGPVGGYTSDWEYDESGNTIGGGIYYPGAGGDSGVYYTDTPPVYVPDGPQEEEYTLWQGPHPVSVYDDEDVLPNPVEILPITKGQADIIINALEKIKLNLFIFKHHTNTISGIDGESMEGFFQRLSTAGAYTNIMKTLANRGEHSYSFVFGTIMGLGEVMLDKILKHTECAPCLNCKESATVTSGSGIGGIAQEVWLNPSAYNSALERLEEIALSILALIDEEEEKYCKAQKVVHNYTTGQQLLNQTKNDPIFETLVDRVFSSPQFKSAIKEVETDASTDKFFPAFKLLEQKTSVTMAELAVAPYPEMGSPCECIDCENNDINLQRYLIKIFSSLGKGAEEGISCKAGVLSSTEFLEGPVGYPGSEGLLGNLGIVGAPGICDYEPCEHEPLNYGACCLTTSTCGNCLQTTLAQCEFYGGEYHGDHTHCTFEECGKCFSNAECVARGELCCDGSCHPPPCPVCEIDDDCLGIDSCCYSGQCGYCPAPTCNPPCGIGLQCCPDFTCCPTCCGGICCGEGESCCGDICCPAGYGCCGGVCCQDIVGCCGNQCGCGNEQWCCGESCCGIQEGECDIDDDCAWCQYCNNNGWCQGYTDEEICEGHECDVGERKIVEPGSCACSCERTVPPGGEHNCCSDEWSCPPGFACYNYNPNGIADDCSCVHLSCLYDDCVAQGGIVLNKCPDSSPPPCCGDSPPCTDTNCCCQTGVCCNGVEDWGGNELYCGLIQECHTQSDCCGSGTGSDGNGGWEGNCQDGHNNGAGMQCDLTCEEWMEWYADNYGYRSGDRSGERGGYGECCGDGCACGENINCCGGECCPEAFQVCCGGSCCSGGEICCEGNCCIGTTCCGGDCCEGNCCSDGCCEDGVCCGMLGNGECCYNSDNCCGTKCCGSDEFCFENQCCPLNVDGTVPSGEVCGGTCPCPTKEFECESDGDAKEQTCCDGQCSLFCCGACGNKPSDYGCCSNHGGNFLCVDGSVEDDSAAITGCGTCDGCNTTFAFAIPHKDLDVLAIAKQTRPWSRLAMAVQRTKLYGSEVNKV